MAGAVVPSRNPFRKIGLFLFGAPALRWRAPLPSVHRTAAALLLSVLLSSTIALPSSAHASDGVVWDAQLTVGNVLFWPNNNERFPLPGEAGDGDGYENERGFRRAHCIGEFIDRQ